MVATMKKRGTAVAQIGALEDRVNELFNAMERIATKFFDDEELEDACRAVNNGDTQLWLKPPSMPRISNFSRILMTARRAGWRVVGELRLRVSSASLDSLVIAWVLDGLAGIVQNLQDTEATGVAVSYLTCFYEIVVEGYEKALAPLISKAEEAGL